LGLLGVRRRVPAGGETVARRRYPDNGPGIHSYLLEHYPAPDGATIADGHPRFALDRNRPTGGGISSGLDEALKLLDLISGTALAQEVQRTTQYYPDPPVSSAIPNTIVSPMPAQAGSEAYADLVQPT